MTGLEKVQSIEMSLNEVLLDYARGCEQWQKARARPSGGFHGNVSVLPSWLGRDGWLVPPLAGDEFRIDEKNRKLNLMSAIWYDPRSVRASVQRLIAKLRESGEFDLAILDCPPGMGFMTHLALCATQLDDTEARAHSVLIWVLVPEPASFAAVYTDVNLMALEFPGCQGRSLFVVNKVPRAYQSPGVELLQEGSLFTALQDYFKRPEIQYAVWSDHLKRVFGGRLHYTVLHSDASHTMLDISPDAEQSFGGGRSGHDPQLTAAGIAKIAPQTILDMLEKEVFST